MEPTEHAPIALLAVVADPRHPPELMLPGAEIQVVGQRPFPGQIIESGSLDAVMLVLPQEDLADRFVEQLEATCAGRTLPLLLASWPGLPHSQALLAERSFDGFLDLGWDPGMQQAALQAALRSFQLGRNVVDIQRQVISSAQVEVAQMRSLTKRDDLTRLYNLRHFEETLEKEHARCQRHGGSYTIVYLDLDGLKEINTRLGHAAGAAALVTFGEVVAKLTRSSNFAFRIGGDEFVALIVGSDPEGAMAYADKLCDTFALTPIEHGGESFQLTVSAGIASYPQDGTTAKEVLHHADEAVYRAKEACPGRPVFWRAETKAE